MPPKKKGAKDKAGDDADHLTRIAIIKTDKCKPKKCRQECKKSCPVVKMGKLCIEVGPKSKLAFISEPLCIGELALDFEKFYKQPLDENSTSVSLADIHQKKIIFSK